WSGCTRPPAGSSRPRQRRASTGSTWCGRNVSGAACGHRRADAPAGGRHSDEGILLMSEAGSAATRVAVVTGAARGIGAATAIRLARDGFAVAVLDLDEGQAKSTVGEIEAAGGKALAVGADVSDADQVA